MFSRLALGLLVAAGFVSCTAQPSGTPVPLPDGEGGIGFDDLRFSAALGKVLVPAGRTGSLDLIDPGTAAVARIAGFGRAPSYAGGHGDGPTSVDEGEGLVFVTDRTAQQLVVVDPRTNAIVARAALAAAPDYVRHVTTTHEVWVTEPAASQIELFALSAGGPPTLSPTATVPIENGPESLVIDGRRGRAYTHRWQRSTLAVDVRTRKVIGEWLNGCAASRGIAMDEQRGFLFAACSEGTVSVLDVDHDGRILSSIARGSGFDVMGYAPRLGHIYVAGGACKCLVVLGVSPGGALSLLGQFAAAGSTHCAVADDRGQAWVCDPDGGRVWRVADTWTASLPGTP
jgi:DNA-binding beta-propeller fold protein YncE